MILIHLHIRNVKEVLHLISLQEVIYKDLKSSPYKVMAGTSQLGGGGGGDEDSQNILQQEKVQIFKTQCLGEGSYTITYKAQYNLLPCIAKTTRSDLVNSQLATPTTCTSASSLWVTVAKIEREFEQLYQLRHPNIVQVLGMYHDDETGLPVLLMETAQENLASFIVRNPMISSRVAVQLDITHDVTLGLHFLHSNGIVHGNLSASNVLMFPSHRAKIADLRTIELPVVRSSDGTVQQSAPNLTHYMAPEVFNNKTTVWSEEMDVFSMGVVFLQLVTGHIPQPHSLESDVEKRFPQINLIERTHPLLSLLTDCLSSNGADRPSTSDLCTRLTSLKSAVRAESPAKFSQRSQSIGSHLSEDESWLPVHVQVMESPDTCGRSLHIPQAFEENPFELDKPVPEHLLPSRTDVLSALGEGEERGGGGGGGGGSGCRKEMRIISKEDEVLEVLRCAVEDKTRELLEKETQMEVVKRDRLELSLRLQQLQKEMVGVKSRNSRMEAELASKEREIQKLRLSVPYGAADTSTSSQSSSLSSMTWRTGPDAPVSGKLGSATALGNLVCIRVAGSSEIHVYDTTKQDWFLTPPCPLDACSLVTVNNTLTVVGGRVDANVTNLLYSIHLKSFNAVKRQPWKEIFPAMLTKRMFAMAVSSGNILAVAGGWNGHQALRTVEVMRLDRDPMYWSRVCSLPSPVYSASACICKGKLYVLGGFTQKGPTKAVLSASIPSLLDSSKDGVWHRPTSLPTYRSTCVTFNDHLLSFGGENDNEQGQHHLHRSSMAMMNDNITRETGAVYEYSTTDGEWYLISEMPVSRCQSCVATLSERREVMVVGGHSGSTGRTQNVQIATLEL